MCGFHLGCVVLKAVIVVDVCVAQGAEDGIHLIVVLYICNRLIGLRGISVFVLKEVGFLFGHFVLCNNGADALQFCGNTVFLTEAEEISSVGSTSDASASSDTAAATVATRAEAATGADGESVS